MKLMDIFRHLWLEFVRNHKNVARFINNGEIHLVFGIGVPTGAAKHYCSTLEQYLKVYQ